MKNFIKALIVVVSVMPITDSFAEKKDCLPGKSCELNLQQKIETSFENARLVALGSFNPALNGLTPEKLSDDELFISVEFTINEIYKGKSNSNILHLKIPVYAPLTKNVPPSPSENVGELFRKYSKGIDTLEREWEDGKIDTGKYKNELNGMRVNVVGLLDYMNKFVVIPIKRGGLDSYYRIADMPLLFGSDNLYVLFLFRDLNPRGVTPLFSWDFDLYHDGIRIPK